MMRIVRRLLVLLLLVSFARGIAPGVSSAQTVDQDTVDATVAATQILGMAVNRQFNAMYDSIHPDAKALIPRVAAVGAFTALYDQYKVTSGTITGMTFEDFTWGVTGQTYRNAAVASFEESYTDDQGKVQTLQDTMPLVKADGKWSWFFGSDPDFVQNVIAQYGQNDSTTVTVQTATRGEAAPTAAPTTDSTSSIGKIDDGDLIANTVNDLDAFYADTFKYLPDVTYSSPKVMVVEPGDSVNTACGEASTGFWGFYCPGDGTLYLEQALLTQLQQQGQAFASAFVIAHEWAHHIQTLLGFTRVTSQPTQWDQVWSIELELMADCFAGAWAQDLATRGMLESHDVDDASAFITAMLGDPSYVSTFDPQAHGSAEMRKTSFLNGYQQGFLGCNVTL